MDLNLTLSTHIEATVRGPRSPIGHTRTIVHTSQTDTDPHTTTETKLGLLHTKLAHYRKSRERLRKIKNPGKNDGQKKTIRMSMHNKNNVAVHNNILVGNVQQSSLRRTLSARILLARALRPLPRPRQDIGLTTRALGKP